MVISHKMKPLDKLPVTFQLQGKHHSEDVHIYPDVSGVILSWKAAKGLRILPEYYPDPVPDMNPRRISTTVPTTDINLVSTSAHTPAESEMMNKYPTVFDGQVRTM